MNICQPHVASTEPIGQSFVVHSEEVEHCRVEVVDLDLVLDGMVAIVVGRAEDGAAFDAAAGQPDGESVRVVIAAVGALGHRRAAELATPDHESRFQQTPGFQVAKQGGDRLVDGAGIVLMPVLEIAVLVPAVGADVRAEQFDEPDAALDQSPRDQALAGEDLGRQIGVIQAIQLPGCL